MKMITKYSRRRGNGFTLIELLVVIAIIGILASLVLVGLSSARMKAKDVRLKSNLSQLRLLSEIILEDNSKASFNAVQSCFNTTSPIRPECKGTQKSIQVIKDDSALLGRGFTVRSSAASKSYCAKVRLISDANKYVCTDHSGAVQMGTVSMCSTNKNTCK